MIFLQKILIASITFRDALSFNIYNTNIRLGEILFYFIAAYNIIFSKNKYKINDRKLFLISCLLLTNLIFTFTVSIFFERDNSFFIKYIIRNFLISFAILSFAINPVKLKEKDYNKIIIFILYFQFFFLIMQIFKLDLFYFRFSYYESFYFGLQRFKGSASESAYIISILVFPLVYFKNKISEGNFYIFSYWLSVIMIFLTFSTFGYAILLLHFFSYLKFNLTGLRKRTFILAIIVVIIISILFPIIFAQNNILIDVLTFNFNKAISYITFQNFDYSTNARLSIQRLAFILYKNLDFFNKIFGMGTGSFSNVLDFNTRYIVEGAAEAHNIYLATLYERGLLGLLIIFIIFSIILFANAKSSVEKALKFSLIVQMLHWFITGNFWLYFFWIEVIYFFNLKLKSNSFPLETVERKSNDTSKM